MQDIKVRETCEGKKADVYHDRLVSLLFLHMYGGEGAKIKDRKSDMAVLRFPALISKFPSCIVIFESGNITS